MTWGFLWLMVFLKLPILALLWLVWWAIHQEPEEAPAPEEDGGSKRYPHHHPRPRLPRSPRRGPHGTPAAAAPARVRTVVARSRRVAH